MKSEKITDEQIDKIFAGVDTTKLDKWTFDFITSTKEYWKKARKLSDKQRNKVAEIWGNQHAKPR